MSEVVEERKQEENEIGHRLIELCSRGDSSGVLVILSTGFDPNFRHKSFGWAGLHVAAREGHLHIARVLLKYGADVNIKDFLGQTPLHRAAQWSRPLLCEYLIHEGANTLAMDDLSQLPMHLANQAQHNSSHSHNQSIDDVKDMLKRVTEERAKKEGVSLDNNKKKKKKDTNNNKKTNQKSNSMVKQRSFSFDSSLNNIARAESHTASSSTTSSANTTSKSTSARPYSSVLHLRGNLHKEKQGGEEGEQEDEVHEEGGEAEENENEEEGEENDNLGDELSAPKPYHHKSNIYKKRLSVAFDGHLIDKFDKWLKHKIATKNMPLESKGDAWISYINHPSSQ